MARENRRASVPKAQPADDNDDVSNDDHEDGVDRKEKKEELLPKAQPADDNDDGGGDNDE